MPKRSTNQATPTATTGSTFEQWCQVTAYHGVLDFYLAKGLFAKIAWFTIVLFGCFLATNQSLELILEFALEDKWTTTMSSEFAQNGALKWPNIMICKIGWSNIAIKDLKRRNLVDPYDIAYYYGSAYGVRFHDRFQSDVPQFTNETELKEKIEQIAKKLNCSFVGDGCFGESDRFTCEETIIACGGGSPIIYPRLDCNCSKYASNTTADECFKINATDILLDTPYRNGDIGISGGIHLLLNPKVDDYYPNVVFGAEHPAAGLRLGIYFDEEEDTALTSPLYLWPSSQIIVSMTPEKHRIKARKRRSISFYDEYLPCTKIGNYKWFNTNTPSRLLCQADCLIQFCAELVNCTMTQLISSSSAIVERKCDKNHTNDCYNKLQSIIREHRFLDSGFNVTGCASECKEPCEKNVVTTTYSSAQFPAPSQLASYTRYLNRVPSEHNHTRPKFNFTEDQVRQFTLLNIFYDRKEYKVVETVNRGSIDELISGIGGVLGVWTGISLISILQAVVYCLHGIAYSIKYLQNYYHNRVQLLDPVYTK